MNDTDLFRIAPCNTEETEFIIAIGNRMASRKKFKTREDAMKHIKSRPWDLIVSAIFACSEATYNEKKYEEEKQ